MNALHLHVNFEYFDAIKRGEKKQEYRLASKWKRKLDAGLYSEIRIYRGYQKAVEGDTLLIFPWRGFSIETITHKHFNNEPVEVCAIRLHA